MHSRATRLLEHVTTDSLLPITTWICDVQLQHCPHLCNSATVTKALCTQENKTTKVDKIKAIKITIATFKTSNRVCVQPFRFLINCLLLAHSLCFPVLLSAWLIEVGAHGSPRHLDLVKVLTYYVEHRALRGEGLVRKRGLVREGLVREGLVRKRG